MSLVQLLSTGKSWVGFTDGEPRYQVRGQRLPRFGSKKNPFRSVVKPEAARLEPKTASCPPPSSSQDEAAPNATQRMPFTAAATLPGNAVRPGAARPVSRLVGKSKIGAWLAKGIARLGSLFVRRPKPARPAIPAFPKPPVQAELSLDHIKVVRNDLSDTDLEIVTLNAKAPAAPGTGHGKLRLEVQSSGAPGMLKVGLQRAVRTVPGRETMEMAWNRVSTRLFGAGKP